jgi:hypothetical protein
MPKCNAYCCLMAPPTLHCVVIIVIRSEILAPLRLLATPFDINLKEPTSRMPPRAVTHCARPVYAIGQHCPVAGKNYKEFKLTITTPCGLTACASNSEPIPSLVTLKFIQSVIPTALLCPSQCH